MLKFILAAALLIATAGSVAYARTCTTTCTGYGSSSTCTTYCW